MLRTASVLPAHCFVCAALESINIQDSPSFKIDSERIALSLFPFEFARLIHLDFLGEKKKFTYDHK